MHQFKSTQSSEQFLSVSKKLHELVSTQDVIELKGYTNLVKTRSLIVRKVNWSMDGIMGCIVGNFFMKYI
jgi:hypothetical protein